jgi:Flp pilus assembly protein TadD
VLDAIDRVAARWPSADLTVLRAVELARAAEYQEPVWEPARLRAAVAALERARSSRPNDVDVAAALAWVRVKAEKAADKGLADVAPLITAFDANTPLSGSQLVSLGAVRLANGQKDKAVAALETARKTAPPSARGSVHLALAYHAAGKTAEAKVFLADARTRPMSPQDRLDLATAEATLLREKQ